MNVGLRSRRTRGQLQREATAYHEAGHAIVALVEGHVPAFISCAPDHEALGRYRSEKGLWFPFGREGVRALLESGDPLAAGIWRRHAESDARVSLAGPVAQKRFARHSFQWGDGLSDEERVEDALGVVYPDPFERNHVRWRLTRQAQQIVRQPEVWSAIDDLAGLLLDVETLEGSPLEALLWKDGGLYRRMDCVRFLMSSP